MKAPEPFLEVRVHEITEPCGLIGLCAGYEENEWRCEQLASHLIEWLPDFALDYSELKSMGSHNAVALTNKAAYSIYTSEKYKNRGEIGELLLHIGIRQVFKTIPAVSKVYFKDSNNDTVKGFDAVHVIDSNDSLELWLGEAKFYKDIKRAVTDAVKEIKEHTKRDYLRSEFLAITNKIDNNWPHAEKLKELLNRNNSLDMIFDQLSIPVFLTYESKTIQSNTKITKDFENKLKQEIKENHAYFISNSKDIIINIHLFLFPMDDKRKLQTAFHKRLELWQALAPR